MREKGSWEYSRTSRKTTLTPHKIKNPPKGGFFWFPCNSAYYHFMKNRTLFIGDVHGCFDELMLLCERMKLTDVDHLYFVGDLINKWPKSLEVIEFVRNRPNTWSVLGNHEYFLMQDSLLEIQNKKSIHWNQSLIKTLIPIMKKLIPTQVTKNTQLEKLQVDSTLKFLIKIQRLTWYWNLAHIPTLKRWSNLD